jgi:ribosomal protein S1
VLDQEQEGREAEGDLKEGTRSGVVRKIMPFGAFVDLGGVDGLVHISDPDVRPPGSASRRWRAT